MFVALYASDVFDSSMFLSFLLCIQHCSYHKLSNVYCFYHKLAIFPSSQIALKSKTPFQFIVNSCNPICISYVFWYGVFCIPILKILMLAQLFQGIVFSSQLLLESLCFQGRKNILGKFYKHIYHRAACQITPPYLKVCIFSLSLASVVMASSVLIAKNNYGLLTRQKVFFKHF